MWLIDFPAKLWYGKEDWERKTNGPPPSKILEPRKTVIDWMDYQTKVMKLHAERHPVTRKEKKTT